MGTSSNEGCFGLLSVIVVIALPIWVGYKTWLWLSPDSFFEILIFLFLWGIFSTIADFVAAGVLAFIASLFD